MPLRVIYAAMHPHLVRWLHCQSKLSTTLFVKRIRCRVGRCRCMTGLIESHSKAAREEIGVGGRGKWWRKNIIGEFESVRCKTARNEIPLWFFSIWLWTTLPSTNPAYLSMSTVQVARPRSKWSQKVLQELPELQCPMGYGKLKEGHRNFSIFPFLLPHFNRNKCKKKSHPNIPK